MNSTVDSRGFFVTGTDTGVGKTVVSLLLMRYFIAKERNPFYLKPFQTGVRSPRDFDGDASFVYRHIDRLKNDDPAESSIYCFPQAKAPLFAAKNAGATIDVRKIERIVEEKAATHDPLIIEGAGGLMVPVTENLLAVDLIRLLQAEPILVARAGLGTINHTLLSVEALRTKGLAPAMILFADSGKCKTPADMIDENARAVEAFSGIRVGAVIDRIEDFGRFETRTPAYVRRSLVILEGQSFEVRKPRTFPEFMVKVRPHSLRTVSRSWDYEQNGEAKLLLQIVNKLQYGHLARKVQIHQSFVANQQLGQNAERAGDDHPLALASAQLRGRTGSRRIGKEMGKDCRWIENGLRKVGKCPEKHGKRPVSSRSPVPIPDLFFWCGWDSVPIIVLRDLRVRIVVDEFLDMRIFFARWVVVADIPQIEVFQDLFDCRAGFEDRNHPHFMTAIGATERVYLVDFLNQPRPSAAELFRRQDIMLRKKSLKSYNGKAYGAFMAFGKRR